MSLKEKMFAELEETAQPLSDFLNKNFDPHTYIIVSADSVKVISDVMSAPLKKLDW